MSSEKKYQLDVTERNHESQALLCDDKFGLVLLENETGKGV